MAKKLDPIEEFLALPDEEKERIWESYNRPVPRSETRPLNAAERALWEKARQRGRPRTGEGADAVNVTIERGLLRRADAYAKANGLTRAQLVARGLAAVIGPETRAGEPPRPRRRKAS